MRSDIKAGIGAIAAAVMLVACAAKGPASSAATASSGGEDDKIASEYQSLIANASDQRICKRQAVTGSRVDRMVCLTRAEMDEQQRNADEVMREMRQSAAMRQQQQQTQQMPQPPPPSTPR